jgi:hypothetical protein
MVGSLVRSLGCVSLLVLASGCYELTPTTGAPHVARSRAPRPAALDQETTLDEVPDGKAVERDFAVRVYRSGRGAGSCSGAVIAPTLVMTALHCVVSMDEHLELTTHVRPAGELHVELGGDYLPWGRVGVVGVRTCDTWTGLAAGDVAVVELSRPVPTDVPLLALPTTEPVPGEKLVSFGYGNEITVMVPETRWRVESVRRHRRQHTAYDVNEGSVLLSGLVVHGDSGGPIVSRTTGELVAIVSQGSDGITAPRSVRTEREHRLDDEMTEGARVDRCLDALGLR